MDCVTARVVYVALFGTSFLSCATEVLISSSWPLQRTQRRVDEFAEGRKMCFRHTRKSRIADDDDPDPSPVDEVLDAIRGQTAGGGDGFLEYESYCRLSSFPGQEAVEQEIEFGPPPKTSKKAAKAKLTKPPWIKPPADTPAEKLRVARAKIKPLLAALLEITGYNFIYKDYRYTRKGRYCRSIRYLCAQRHDTEPTSNKPKVEDPPPEEAAEPELTFPGTVESAVAAAVLQAAAIDMDDSERILAEYGTQFGLDMFASIREDVLSGVGGAASGSGEVASGASLYIGHEPMPIPEEELSVQDRINSSLHGALMEGRESATPNAGDEDEAIEEGDDDDDDEEQDDEEEEEGEEDGEDGEEEFGGSNAGSNGNQSRGVGGGTSDTSNAREKPKHPHLGKGKGWRKGSGKPKSKVTREPSTIKKMRKPRAPQAKMERFECKGILLVNICADDEDVVHFTLNHQMKHTHYLDAKGLRSRGPKPPPPPPPSFAQNLRLFDSPVEIAPELPIWEQLETTFEIMLEMVTDLRTRPKLVNPEQVAQMLYASSASMRLFAASVMDGLERAPYYSGKTIAEKLKVKVEEKLKQLAIQAATPKVKSKRGRKRKVALVEEPNPDDGKRDNPVASSSGIVHSLDQNGDFVVPSPLGAPPTHPPPPSSTYHAPGSDLAVGAPPAANEVDVEAIAASYFKQATEGLLAGADDVGDTSWMQSLDPSLHAG